MECGQAEIDQAGLPKDSFTFATRTQKLRYAENNPDSMEGERETSAGSFRASRFRWVIVLAVGLLLYSGVAHPATGQIPTLRGSSENSSFNQPPLPQQPLWRGVSFQNKLVPFRKRAQSPQQEYVFPTNVPPTNQRFPATKAFPQPGVTEFSSQQPDKRPIQPSISLPGEPLESLPEPFTGVEGDNENVIVQRFSNGKPRVVRHVAQDQNGNFYNHGAWEARNQQGQVVARGNYVRGRMDGQWSRIHETNSSSLFKTKPFNQFQGPFRSVAQFKDGKLDGIWAIYDQYRTKVFEIPYQQGIRHGTATWFYPNTGRMREATFRRGLLHGEILEFDDAEKISKRQQYVDGRPIVRNTTFYRPNVKKTEDYYLGKKLEPESKDDWWTAKPTPFVESGDETQNGSAMSWYENGQPQKTGQYTDGKPVGQFVWWHPNGNKQTEGFYIDGKKNRRWTWWHENGMKQIDGIFEDDQPVGVWRAWHSDGELRSEKDYSNRESRSDGNSVLGTMPTNREPPVEPTNDGNEESVLDQARPGGEDEPEVSAPTNSPLPVPPETGSNDPTQPLESIAPLEISPPNNARDESPDRPSDSGADDAGTILLELIEPISTDSDPSSSKIPDKST